MRNNRDGDLSRCHHSNPASISNNNRFSFCCGWGDHNGDAWPDLYVVNDFGRKNLYRNNGDGTFTDIAPDAGVEDVGAGMSVCWLDYDNDGRQDLYVADMWTAAGNRISEQESFQKNAGDEAARAVSETCHGQFDVPQSRRRNILRMRALRSGAAMGRWSWSQRRLGFRSRRLSRIFTLPMA